MNYTRYIYQHIKKDLKEKMVLIGGPRQVGKTTLARSYIKNDKQYLTWDDLEDRNIIKKHQVNTLLKLVVLDEIHKYKKWRMLLKGLFDKYGEKLKIIVTGSAKLDYFRKGGDSLFGRYHYYRLHPLTISEVIKNEIDGDIYDLLKFSGFPEPFRKKNVIFHKRWQRERLARVVSQDISDLGTVKELSLIELLVDALPERVGQPLSIKSLQEDLEVSPNTISRWIALLEQIYYCYRILPYGPAKIRAVKKTSVLYLWDWSEVENPGFRFENLVASHLLKYCHYIEDTEGDKMELRYIRDIDGREIDFVILKNKKPVFAVECKTGEKSFSKHLFYFKERTSIPQFYQVHLGTKDYVNENCRVLPFSTFCEIEKIP